MLRAAIFDIDGTLVHSVDLHASAWQEALIRFGHEVTFEQTRSQIGKGGDQFIPMGRTKGPWGGGALPKTPSGPSQLQTSSGPR